MTGMDSHTHGILLYDGECLFCHASMRFIVDRDAAGYFRFGAAQDERAQPLLQRYGLADITASTIVLIEQDQVHLRSTAALRRTESVSASMSSSCTRCGPRADCIRLMAASDSGEILSEGATARAETTSGLSTRR